MLTNKYWMTITLSSLLCAACGGGSSSGSGAGNNLVNNGEELQVTSQNPPVAVATGLNRLLGTVTFSWNFFGDEDTFSQTVTYSSGSYLDNDTLAGTSTVGDPILCTEINVGGFEFLCTRFVQSSLGTPLFTSNFLFSLQSQTSGSGLYEFCGAESGELDPVACAEELAETPDGEVRVAISSVFASKHSSPDSHEIDSPAMDKRTQYDLLSAKDAEYGGQVSLDSSYSEQDTLTEAARLVSESHQSKYIANY